MSDFPRTDVEGVSLPRMIVGTNWFLGWSHTSAAKDKFIRSTQTPQRIADVLAVFLDAGIDAVMGFAQNETMYEAVQRAEQAAGRKMILVSTPPVPTAETDEALDEARGIFDEEQRLGVSICMPHSGSTDQLVDRRARKIRRMSAYLEMIRQRGMIPGLSTHMPEVPVYADESGLDVATYIQIYNAAGFLMQIEVDWVYRMIWQRARPVMTIKPMAAGRLDPLVGMAFVWATLRERDMVTVGTATPDEARELIDISLALLERRVSGVELQRTRSKASLAAAGGE